MTRIASSASPPVAACGERAKPAVPILEQWLSSNDKFCRVTAAGHLLMIDPSRSDEMMPDLMKALANENTVIQRQARSLLDELTPFPGQPQNPALTKHEASSRANQVLRSEGGAIRPTVAWAIFVPASRAVNALCSSRRWYTRKLHRKKYYWLLTNRSHVPIVLSLKCPWSDHLPICSPASKVLDDFVRPTIYHQLAMWCGRLRSRPGVAACRWLRFPEPLAAKFAAGIDSYQQLRPRLLPSRRR